MKEYHLDNLDQIDLAILSEMQENGRISNSELARRISLSQPATHTRLKRLETLGIIKKHVSLLDRDKLGFDLICFFHIRLQVHSKEAPDLFEAHIHTLPNIIECHFLTGHFDYLLKAIFRSRAELEQFERHAIRAIPNIAQVNTSVALSEIKSTTKLPLGREKGERQKVKGVEYKS